MSASFRPRFVRRTFVTLIAAAGIAGSLINPVGAEPSQPEVTGFVAESTQALPPDSDSSPLDVDDQLIDQPLDEVELPAIIVADETQPDPLDEVGLDATGKDPLADVDDDFEDILQWEAELQNAEDAEGDPPMGDSEPDNAGDVRSFQPFTRSFAPMRMSALRAKSGYVSQADCGDKVAIVFDLSGSINSTELNDMKQAAQEVIDEVEGTPTRLGLYNYSTQANVVPGAVIEDLPMDDPDNVAQARAAVGNLRSGGYTNWADGLRQMVGKGYREVYFLTDGYPNSNSVRGYLSDTDITDAIDAAKDLTDSGSALIGVSIQLDQLNEEPVRAAGSSSQWRYWTPDMPLIPGTRHFDYFMVGTTRQEYAGEETREFLGRWQAFYNGLWRNMYSRHYAETIDIFREVVEETIETDSFKALPIALSEVSRGCRADLKVTKHTIDHTGQEISDTSGWDFTAEYAHSGSKPLAAVTEATDAEGVAEFQLPTNKVKYGDKAGKSTITETIPTDPNDPHSRYTLKPDSDGAHTTCSAVDRFGNVKDVVFNGTANATTIALTNEGETGFKLDGLAFGDDILCEVTNELPAPNFAVTKTAPATPRVLTGQTGQTFTVDYEVTVENTSTVDGVPDDLVDKPAPIEGLSVESVSVSNASDPGLVGAGGVDLTAGADGTYTLASADMVSIPAGQTRTLTWRVTYKVTDAAQTNAAEDTYACAAPGGEPEPGRGVYNSIETENYTNPAASDVACTDLARPEMVVKKFIDNVDAQEKPNAVEIAPDAASVTVKYTVENTGTVDLDAVAFSDKIEDPTGGSTTEDNYLDISGLNCTNGTTAVQTNGVKVTFDPKLAPGVTAECSVSIPSGDLGFYGEDHLDTVSSQGFYTVPPEQNTPDAPPVESSDSAWAHTTIPLAIAKTSKEEPRVITGGSNQTLSATYEVTVTNSSTFIDATPGDITETPQPADGVRVTGITALPPTSGASLVKTESAFTKTSDSEWTLASSYLEEVLAGATATMLVRVDYAIDDPAAVATGSQTCASGDSGSAGTGLSNSVSLPKQGDDTVEAQACVDLVRPGVGISKKINGLDANEADSAVAIASDATTVDLTYVVTNTGSTKLNTVTFTDSVLNPVDGTTTDEKLPLSGLSCPNGTTTENVDGVTVEFEPALAPGTDVECTVEIQTKELGFSGTDHANRVEASATYPVPDDQNTTDIPPVTADDPAWATTDWPWSITKTANGDPRVITGAAPQDLTALYTVTVTNESAFLTGVPEYVVEHPQPAEGITVKSVTAQPAETGDSLVTEAKSFTANTDGTYTLAGTQLVDTAPGSSSSMIVRVDFAIDDPAEVPESSDSCSTGDGGPAGSGLANTAALPPVGDSVVEATACTDLLRPGLQVAKDVNGYSADTKDEAGLIMPGDEDLEIAYTVVNTGSIDLNSVSFTDAVVDPDTGSENGEHLAIADLVCSGATVTADSPSPGEVTALFDTPLTPGDSITCTWKVPLADLELTDGWHADNVHASGTYPVPDDQNTPDDQQPTANAEDPAWAVQVPQLDGYLPKTGGRGVTLQLLAGLVLFAAAAAIRRRRT